MAKVTFEDLPSTNTPINAANLNNNFSYTAPVGGIMQFGGTTAPTGWLICDGSAVSRTTYADLFSAIGTSYGSGNGSTTFNVPNLKGKIPVGYNSSETEFNTMGKTGGSKEMQKHRHSIQFSNAYLGSGGTQVGNIVVSTVSGGVDTTEAGTGTSGNLQPYVVVNYIIKY